MDKDLIIKTLRSLVEVSVLPAEKKDLYLQKLTLEKLKELSLEEGAELLKILEETLDDQEQMVVSQPDPDVLNDFVDAKEFLNDLVYEAEKKAITDLGAASN